MSDPRASGAVGQAIRQGKLPHPTTLRCMDCGATATCYDHYLGYAREHWLDVQPVCDRHNGARAWAPGAKERSTSGHSAVLVRFPTWLLEELDRDSMESSRSRNSQLIWILRQRYPIAAAAHKDERGYGPRGSRVREPEVAYVWQVA